MQVLATNPYGRVMYLHVSEIRSTSLRKKYGNFSINFFDYPNQNQANEELVTKVLVSLILHRPEWKFQVL